MERLNDLISVRLPHRWRAPAFDFFNRRSWWVAAFALAVVVAMSVASRSIGTEPLLQVSGMATFVIPLALARRLGGTDRTFSAWALLFQRPVRPSDHYWRAVAVGGLALVASLAIMCVAMLLGRGGPGGTGGRVLTATMASCCMTGIILFVTAAGTSSIVRKSDTELVLFLVFLSYVQGLFAGWMLLPDWGTIAIECVLFPVNGIAGIASGIARSNTSVGPWRVVHVVLYPLAWVVILHLRLRHFDNTAAAPSGA